MKTFLIIYCAFCYGFCICKFFEWLEIAPLKYNLYHWYTNVYLDLVIVLFKVLLAPIFIPLKIIFELLKPIMEK